MNQKTNKTRAVLHHAKAKRRFTSAVHAREAGLARDSWSNPEKPIRRSQSTSPPPAGLAQTPAGGGRAGGGRRGSGRGRTCARARVRGRGACACVCARVRVSERWAARRARQSITGQVLPRRLRDALPPSRPPARRAASPLAGRPRTADPAPQARAVSGAGGPGNPRPRVPRQPPPSTPPRVVIDLTFSAGSKGRIAATRGGSFRPREVFFQTGICGYGTMVSLSPVDLDWHYEEARKP
nr:5E5 antigen-like [Ovis aries]